MKNQKICPQSQKKVKPQEKQSKGEPEVFSQGKPNNSAVQNQDDNPYLIFHSPCSYDKSPFKKQGQTRKYKNVIQRSNAFKSKNSSHVKRRQKLIEKPALCFTNKFTSINHKAKMGMILVSKANWMKSQTLTYSKNLRTVTHTPKCDICQKLFKNHEALGGHIRTCKKQTMD